MSLKIVRIRELEIVPSVCISCFRSRLSCTLNAWQKMINELSQGREMLPGKIDNQNVGRSIDKLFQSYLISMRESIST